MTNHMIIKQEVVWIFWRRKKFLVPPWIFFYLYICYIVIVIYTSSLFGSPPPSFPSGYCHHIYPTVACPDWHSSRSIRLNLCTWLQLGQCVYSIACFLFLSWFSTGMYRWRWGTQQVASAWLALLCHPSWPSQEVHQVLGMESNPG